MTYEIIKLIPLFISQSPRQQVHAHHQVLKLKWSSSLSLWFWGHPILIDSTIFGEDVWGLFDSNLWESVILRVVYEIEC